MNRKYSLTDSSGRNRKRAWEKRDDKWETGRDKGEQEKLLIRKHKMQIESKFSTTFF